MTLLNNLWTIKPDENSGPRSSNRFSFQKNWALITALELHQDNKDYLIIMDYHDDVLILDSEDNPTKITFYQIKTKSSSKGNWSINSLSKPKKGADGPLNSILGKLYANKIIFQNDVDTLNIVSNMPYTVKLNNGKDAKNLNQIIIPFSLFSQNVKDELLANLNKELQINDCSEIFDIAFLHITSLSLLDPKTHALGKVSEFVENFKDSKINPNLFYKYLYNEFELKNDYEPVVTSLNELMTNKAVRKSNITALLERLTPSSDSNNYWKELKQKLQETGEYTLFDIKHLESSWKECEARIRTDCSPIFLSIREFIKEKINIYVKVSKTEIELLKHVLKDYKEHSWDFPEYLYTEYFITALILFEYSLMAL